MSLASTCSSPNTPSSTATAPIGVGLIGLGTVGRGTYKLIERQPHLQVKGIAVRSLDKDRGLEVLDKKLMTTDVMSVVENPDVQLVVEVIGGIEPAKSVIKRALELGKPVVSANKELIAKHGPELFALAEANQTSLLFEGAVAGGIPILMPIKQSLAGNQVEQIAGILNGTTNYILTRMVQDGWSFADALSKAQALGYAEADPTSDVEGFDAAYKIALLAQLGFGQPVPVDKVHIEGISTLKLEDINAADTLGYAVKLLGLATRVEQEGKTTIDVRVHPMLVDKLHPLASVHNEYNAIFVQGDAVGDCMFYGKGAGELPTASAVMGDVLAIAADKVANNPLPVRSMSITDSQPATVLPISETFNQYYLRITTQDITGVVGELGKVFGRHGVSLRSILQEACEASGTASLTIVTHRVKESDLKSALDGIRQQETTRSIDTLLRVL